MNSKIVFVSLVLIASFALPTLAIFEKDFISAESVRAILEKTSVNGMPSEDVINALTSKTVISNVVLQEALFEKVDHSVNGRITCVESCIVIPCVTGLLRCYCSNHICYKNSIDM